MKKRSRFPNPIENLMESRRIKKEEKRKKKKQMLFAAIGLYALVMIIAVIMSIIESRDKKSKNSDTVESVVADTQDIESVKEETEEEHLEVIETEPVNSTEQTDISSIKVDTYSDTTDDSVITESKDEMDESLLYASDLRVSAESDYYHADTSVIRLGNDEGCTIKIESSKELNADDILIIYDEELFSVSQIDSPSDYCIKYYITGRKPANTQIGIVTYHEYMTLGDAAKGYLLDIVKYDSAEGKVCYLTPNGEKYHFSASCAGENAVKTTYHDAMSWEAEPCGNCVK